MTKATTMIAIALLAACAPRTQPAPPPVAQAATRAGAAGGIPIASLPGRFALRRPHTLCDALTRFNGGAGVYRVERMTSRMEPMGDDPELVPHTYVELELIERWSPTAPEAPTARIPGGVDPQGRVVSASVALVGGEEVALLLLAPTAYNRGYYALDEVGTFRFDAKVAAFTNGMHDLPSTRPAAAQLIGRTYGRDMSECRRHDVKARADHTEAAPARSPLPEVQSKREVTLDEINAK